MKNFDVIEKDISLDGSFSLVASAGTGKTFAITQLVLRLLLEGVSYGEDIGDHLHQCCCRGSEREDCIESPVDDPKCRKRKYQYLESYSDSAHIDKVIK